MESSNPADNSILLFQRLGREFGIKGTIALKRIAPWNNSERRKNMLTAILAPFENPIAIVLSKSNL